MTTQNAAYRDGSHMIRPCAPTNIAPQRDSMLGHHGPDALPAAIADTHDEPTLRTWLKLTSPSGGLPLRGERGDLRVREAERSPGRRLRAGRPRPQRQRVLELCGDRIRYSLQRFRDISPRSVAVRGGPGPVDQAKCAGFHNRSVVERIAQRAGDDANAIPPSTVTTEPTT
jgi:hypothetical protein